MIKNSLGFLLPYIDNTEQYNIIFNNISKLIQNNIYSNILVFNSRCDKISTNNIPILHINHAKFFKGDLFLFDISGLILTKQFTNVNRKLLYCNDMPWLKIRNTNYSEWEGLYYNNNSGIDFIVTNKYLYDIYSLCWKQPIGTMENFDYEKIQELLR